MRSLVRFLQKKERIGIGLMSGTSADGVDAVIAEFRHSGRDTQVRLIAHHGLPFPGDVQERIHSLASGSAEEICRMNFLLGEFFARAAFQVAERAQLPILDVDFIGSHGQTILHLPAGAGRRNASTLQIGEGAVIAERTGVLTVSDFRYRDMAAGGEGAPLVPLADHILFHDPEKVRMTLNVGGMANVTLLPRDPSDIVAFDTGPGNVLIDEVATALSGGQVRYDRDGGFAREGQVDAALLAELLDHPYLHRPPPKSTGRETFGTEMARGLMERFPRERWKDLAATLARFTVRSIRTAYDRFVAPVAPAAEMFVSGGGAKNPVILGGLREAFRELPVKTMEEIGYPGGAREALAFGILANETLHGNAGNVPGATGARRGVILGKINLV